MVSNAQPKNRKSGQPENGSAQAEAVAQRTVTPDKAIKLQELQAYFPPVREGTKGQSARFGAIFQLPNKSTNPEARQKIVVALSAPFRQFFEHVFGTNMVFVNQVEADDAQADTSNWPTHRLSLYYPPGEGQQKGRAVDLGAVFVQSGGSRMMVLETCLQRVIRNAFGDMYIYVNEVSEQSAPGGAQAAGNGFDDDDIPF